MVRILAEATGSISFSMRGEKGESGDTPYVTKTVVDYAITSSVSESKNWSSTAPDASAAANKGKFLWTRTTYTWSNNKTTEVIIYTYIGKDGDKGTSVTIKGSKGSTSELPTSGNTLGDGYIIGGYLWVYTGTSKTDSTHAKGFENVGKIQGDPGTPAVQYYTHIAWMDDSKGTGFTVSANGKEHAYVGVLVDKTPTDSEDWTKYDWSYIKGATGATGNGIKSIEVTYQIGSSGTTPPKGAWSTSVPNITDANPYLWTRTIFKYTNGTDSKPSYSVATRGTKGALMREHDGFESGKYKYLSGSGAEAYIDVVCVSGSWYQCIQTYETDSPSLDKHWKLMSNYKSIATHLLLAENATINMLGTNQINLFNPTTDGKMFGSFRVVSDDNDYALWLGAPNGADAPFSVTKDGSLYASNGIFAGELKSVTGSFHKLTAVSSDGKKNAGSIYFDSSGYITFDADIFNQGYNSTAKRGWRLYASTIWCRQAFGHRQSTLAVVIGDVMHVYPDGYDSGYTSVNLERVSYDNQIVYKIPLYGGSGDLSGCPIDVVVFSPLRANDTYYYEFVPRGTGKRWMAINANDHNNGIHFCDVGGWHQLNGGNTINLVYINPELLNPSQKDKTYFGRGIFWSGENDLNWINR
jgi:hypothetical protein